ncbi:hypothetical protein IWX49DRAFT_113681 [Phyllosticta citricarpa]
MESLPIHTPPRLPAILPPHTRSSVSLSVCLSVYPSIPTQQHPHADTPPFSIRTCHAPPPPSSSSLNHQSRTMYQINASPSPHQPPSLGQTSRPSVRSSPSPSPNRSQASATNLGRYAPKYLPTDLPYLSLASARNGLRTPATPSRQTSSGNGAAPRVPSVDTGRYRSRASDWM